jgi:hypothetical protein
MTDAAYPAVPSDLDAEHEAAVEAQQQRLADAIETAHRDSSRRDRGDRADVWFGLLRRVGRGHQRR